MKNYNQFFKSVAVVCLGILFVQCSDDDDATRQSIPTFSESDLSIIHKDSQSSWRIVEVYNKYYDPNYDLEITTDCVTDDVYTFTAGTEAVTIDFGEVLCFEDIEDGIFTADHEFFVSNLKLMDGFKGNSIYLHFARGYINDDQTAQASTFTHYSLAELSENRMVFQKGGEFIGNYHQTLVFERLE